MEPNKTTLFIGRVIKSLFPKTVGKLVETSRKRQAKHFDLMRKLNRP